MKEFPAPELGTKVYTEAKPLNTDTDNCQLQRLRQ